MNEQKKGCSELPVLLTSKALADPTCEEGGSAKLRELVDANPGKTILCETDPADFCTTEKKERAGDEEFPLSRS